MPHVIQEADLRTEVLLVHAPYPGRLKFDALPSSLLHAFAPFAARLAAAGRLSSIGYLDPRRPSATFLERVEELLRWGRARVVCVCTSTAAIEEAAAIVARVRAVAGDEVLVLVGGPHEDACETKVVGRVAGVDLSVGGDAEFFVDWLLTEFLSRDESPALFCDQLPGRLHAAPVRHGKVEVSCERWGRAVTKTIEGGRLVAADLVPPAWIDRLVHFEVFDCPRTLPLLVSRGCSWGRCTFCSEALSGGGQVTANEFGWVAELLDAHRGAAVYFQDSIFPLGGAARERLLPLLRASRVEWGCQVFLPTLSREKLRLLAESGCRYIYTGLESASADVLAEVGKPNLNAALALERLGWTREFDLRVGVSLMFGSMGRDGSLLETEATVDATVALSHSILGAGVNVVGFYPNVETVLPGTALARSLASSGVEMDFYHIPKCESFEDLEDGGVGINFATLPGRFDEQRSRLIERIRDASREVEKMGESVTARVVP